MAEYLVRKVLNEIEVTKFEEYTHPIASYRINSRGCNCPSRYRSCKHVTIVKAWRKHGEIIGQVLDDVGNEVTILPVTLQ